MSVARWWMAGLGLAALACSSEGLRTETGPAAPEEPSVPIWGDPVVPQRPQESFRPTWPDLPGSPDDTPPPEPPPRTVVTLSFDDGMKSQRVVPEILARYGLRGSFFVCTGRLGGDDYLDWEDVAAIAAAGHEIGGHTVDHDALGSLGRSKARRAVCNDREALVERGFEPVSFAYPKADGDEDTAELVEECGYQLARINTGLRRQSCDECPVTESFDPPNRFLLRSPGSLKRRDSADDLRDMVLEAEEVGGWLALTFHDILKTCGSRTYCTDVDDFEEFVEWLAQRRELGTVVKTQREAFGLGPPPRYGQ